jgi:transposase
VAIGKWRPAQTRQRKQAMPARRAINRITYDHALSRFIGYLKDKAARSTSQKQVQDVSEAHSTRNCPKCGKPTGPAGKEGLTMREWMCVNCNTAFQRDAASAWQIAKRFKAEVASTSQPVESQDSANSASVLTQV